jgi:DksA/TraR C4-type zinc finger protein
MEDQIKYCRICQAEIPEARLRALPDTLVCIQCSERIGGEFDLKVTITGTGKTGSLKKTGESVTVKKVRRPLK